MPPTFRFFLQPMLDRCARVEEEKKQVLGQRRLDYERAARELGYLSDTLRSCAAELRECVRTLSTADLRAHDSHLQFLGRAVGTQARLLAERHSALERASQELTNASKERKVLEKLKERRRRAFDAREFRLEELELDDANARCHEGFLRAKPE
jgi:flagellar protein FliJ